MVVSLPATIEPSLSVDWAFDGSYTGTYDELASAVDGDPGVTIQQGRDQARSLSPPMIAAIDWELLNQDGAYSQERPGSPVYQLVVPGRPVQVQARHGTVTAWRNGAAWRDNQFWRGLGTYTLAKGMLEDISQTAQIGHQRVKMSALGLMKKMKGRLVSCNWQPDLRTDQCLTVILDAIGWPAADRVIGAGDTTLAWWGADETDAWDAAVQLLVSEGPGALYEDGEGRIHFEGRNYRTVAARSTTSQATFYDLAAGPATDWRNGNAWRSDLFWRGTAPDLFLTDLTYEPGFKNIVNRATYATKRRAMGSMVKVWEYGASLTLGGLEVRKLIARASDPFTNMPTPVLGTDYALSSGTATVMVQQVGGATAHIVITAGGGGCVIDGVTSNGIQVRAQPLAVTSEVTMENNVDASDSATRFGTRTYDVPGWPEIDPNQAISVCNAWVTRYMTQRPIVTIQVENADGNHLDKILRLGVSDRITVRETNTGLAADLWVEKKEIKIGVGGRHVVCVLGCEKVENVGGSAWDVGLWDSAVWGT